MAKMTKHMDNNAARLFKDLFNKLDGKTLGDAIQAARKLVDTYPQLIYAEELENIENNYKLMLGYMRQGFIDPQRENIYNDLLARLYRFASDFRMSYLTQNVPFFTEMSRKSANRNFTNDGIKQELENFVADVAMLSLETEPGKTTKSKELYRRHNDFMQALFCHITVSKQWSEHDAEAIGKLLLSPTIDTIDAQLIVSALTIATMNSFDTSKFNVLLDTYLKAHDEKIRQKALVGWVFSLPSNARIPDRLKSKINDILKDTNIANELIELQKQIVFCMNTQQDADKIQRDIMPELIKNNNLNITRFGITEKEEDPMADVFDPGASDRAMEKMEESFKKMMNMQKAGSDIYFGGFSQMKRFPFFYNVANWFYPFHIEHPDISNTVDNLKGTPLLVNILNNGPFCDSDKYSFTLAVSSVINRLPDNMKEMINTPDALGQVVSSEEQEQPTYVRRMILQDMYRFFRLFTQRGQLVNPFDIERFTFVSNDAFSGTKIKEYIPDLCYFMIKHKNKDALKNILSKYDDLDDTRLQLVKSVYLLNFKNAPGEAVECLESIRNREPDNKRILSLLARAYFESGKYERSAQCYEALHETDPGNSTVSLNYCVALAKSENYEKATNLLYKLDIENPNSTPITRVLAWNLMGLGKYEQAEKAYNRLLKSDEAETGDRLNAGYCQWLKGDIKAAAMLFKDFMKANGNGKQANSISSELMNDYEFLTKHGISEIDIRLMADLTTYEA